MAAKVLVVGAGPVGLTMALELARYQIPLRIVDKMTARSETSRAAALWSRTLELLDRAGTISAELIALGNKVDVANIVAGRSTIARVELKHVPTPYPFVLMLPQSETERVLEQHLAGYGVRTELGVELVDCVQDGEGVTVALRTPDGKVESERYDRVVACDGSHSPIRHHLGLAFDGDTMGTDWALGDFQMSGAPFPLNELATYWHEDGPIVFFPMAPGRYRVIASLGPTGSTPREAPTLEAFQEIVGARGPGGIKLEEAIWLSAFRINERQVETYRAGRIFLAGDAAHVHSPAGGQGMNTGMQDAVNLAWKLALVYRGLATNSALLDSYTIERHAVGAEVILAAGRMTKIATLQNPLARHVRDTLGHLLLGLSPIQRALEGSMTETSIGYPDSPLNGPHWASDLRSGDRMPPRAGEMPYGTGTTPRFALRAGPKAGEPPFVWLGEIVEPAVRPMDASGIELVRPDGYLALSAPDGGWDIIVDYLDEL